MLSNPVTLNTTIPSNAYSCSSAAASLGDSWPSPAVEASEVDAVEVDPATRTRGWNRVGRTGDVPTSQRLQPSQQSQTLEQFEAERNRNGNIVGAIATGVYGLLCLLLGLAIPAAGIVMFAVGSYIIFRVFKDIAMGKMNYHEPINRQL